ncbi:MAG: hypothetical protein DRJ40_02860 [Thermoprotei archaeon]|nr:MAG: hypothetical protein DRJ40_02860 [Thermoprotei archaeon]
MDKVREGVTIKIRKDVHRKLVEIVGKYVSKYGEKVTYSDVIDALLHNTADPVEAIRKWIKSQTIRGVET